MKIFAKRQGFSLIEILIAMIISSALMLSLYQMYKQVQRAVISINNVIDIDTPLAIMYNRFEIDFGGMIVPSGYKSDLRALQNKEKKESEQSADNAKKDQTKEPAKEPVKKIEDTFHYSGGKNFKLTFLTTGGIKSIDTTTDTGGNTSAITALKPYIKRVFYTLEPDKNTPDTYTLMWGQTDKLDATLNDSSSTMKYELAWGIKQLTMSFFVYDVPKEEGETKGKPALITLTSFDPKEVFEKYKTYVPAYISIKGIIADERDNRTQDFFFEFNVPSYTLPEKEKEHPEEKKAPEPAQTAQPEKISPNSPPKPPVAGGGILKRGAPSPNAKVAQTIERKRFSFRL